MHPPPFLLWHRLLDWPDCHLELTCCKGTVLYPVRLLAQTKGNATYEEVLRKLKCSACGAKPLGPIYLCAGKARRHNWGAPPDWAIEIMPAPNPPEG